MEYTVTPGEKSTMVVKMTFGAEEVAQAVDRVYLRQRNRISVPGFRKGKVPKNVIFRYYGADVFNSDAADDMLNRGYGEVLDKEKDRISPVGMPSCSVDEWPEGNDGVIISAVIPVTPDVKLSAYKGLRFPRFEARVTDADIDDAMLKRAEKDVRDVDVADRPCKEGDTVTIDFKGYTDGVQFDGGTADDYKLVLGSNSFIPGFEQQVEGMTIGEERNLDVTFPEDYQAEDLKGKPAVFEVTLKGITERKYPDLDDAFAKKYGGCDTIDEFRAKTRENTEKSAKRKADDTTFDNVVDVIARQSECEIPDVMIEDELDHIVNNVRGSIGNGITLEDYLEYCGMTMEQFRESYKEIATLNVLTRLVANKITETENITGTEEGLDKMLAENASLVDKTVEEYKAGLSAETRERLMESVRIENLKDFLYENNEFYTVAADVNGKAAEPVGDNGTPAGGAPAGKPSKESESSDGGDISVSEAEAPRDDAAGDMKIPAKKTSGKKTAKKASKNSNTSDPAGE